MDPPGFGGSTEPVDPASLEVPALAELCARIAEGSSLDHPVFVGHSWGGTVGLYTAGFHPGLFSTLVLLDFDVSERIRTATTAKALVECGSKIGAPPLDTSLQARGRFVLLYLPRHCLLDRKLLGDRRARFHGPSRDRKLGAALPVRPRIPCRAEVG